MQSVCLKLDGFVIEILLLTGLAVCKNLFFRFYHSHSQSQWYVHNLRPKMRAFKVNAKCVSQVDGIVIEILLLTGIVVCEKTRFWRFIIRITSPNG